MRIAYNDTDVEEIKYLDFTMGTSDNRKTFEIFISVFGSISNEFEYVAEFNDKFNSKEEASNFVKPYRKQLLEQGWLDLGEMRDAGIIEIY